MNEKEAMRCATEWHGIVRTAEWNLEKYRGKIQDRQLLGVVLLKEGSGDERLIESTESYVAQYLHSHFSRIDRVMVRLFPQSAAVDEDDEPTAVAEWDIPLRVWETSSEWTGDYQMPRETATV